MKPSLLAFAIALATVPLAASAATAKKPAAKTPTAADAHAFVEKMNAEYKAQYLQAIIAR